MPFPYEDICWPPYQNVAPHHFLFLDLVLVASENLMYCSLPSLSHFSNQKASSKMAGSLFLCPVLCPEAQLLNLSCLPEGHGNAASLLQCWDSNPALSGSEDLGLLFPTAPGQEGMKFLEGRTLVTGQGLGSDAGPRMGNSRQEKSKPGFRNESSLWEASVGCWGAERPSAL